MKSSRILPPTYFLVAIVCMLILRLALPLAPVIPTPWNTLGAIPVSVGAAMNIIADRYFRRAGTTIRPFEVSTNLVTGGPFRYSRNPMYLGFVLMLGGMAVLLGSLSPFFIAFLFALAMDRLFIPTEEHMLAERFGEIWRAYAAATRRWV